MVRKQVPDPLSLNFGLTIGSGQRITIGSGYLSWTAGTFSYVAGGGSVHSFDQQVQQLTAQNSIGITSTGNLQLNSGGPNGGMKLGSIAADTNYACIWSGQATPSFANAAFFANATATTVGAPAAGSVSLRCGNDTTAHLQLTQANGIILDRGDSSASPGNATVSKTSGLVAVANGASSVTITNTRVTTSSIVIAVLQDNTDAIYVRSVVPASGSFTINLSGATSGARKVGFLVLNS